MNTTTMLRQSTVLTGRTFAHWRAQPGPFLVNLLFPVLVLVMMGGLLGGAISGSVGEYFQFAVPGVLAVAMLFGIGFAMVSFFAVCNTLLQYLVTDEMRGRVMSIWMLTFIGVMPFGSIIAGGATERFGAPRTLAAGGLVITLFVMFIAVFDKRLRAID